MNNFNDNYITENLPAYLQKYTDLNGNGFLKWIKGITNYVLDSKDALSEFLNKFSISSTSSYILEYIAKILNVSLDDVSKLDINYVESLRTAIKGTIVKRSISGDYESIRKALVRIYEDVSISIRDDASIPYSSSVMTALITLELLSDTAYADIDVFNKYLAPNITGVSMIFQLLVGNVFALDYAEEPYTEVEINEGKKVPKLCGWNSGSWGGQA